MLVIDEYLAVDVTLGDWPAGLPDDEALLLPASWHFRLLQRIHQSSGGQLTTSLARLPDTDRQALRNPNPEVLQILDPRPLLDETARIGASYTTGGLLVCETLAAGWSTAASCGSGPAATSAVASPRSPTTSTSPSTPPNPPADIGPAPPRPSPRSQRADPTTSPEPTPARRSVPPVVPNETPPQCST